MKRLVGWGISLAAVLSVVWFFFGREAAVISATADAGPQFYPAATQAAAAVLDATVETTGKTSNTSVVAHRLISYDGPFLEDGSQEELVGVAALELRNTGDTVAEYVQAVVQQGQRQLHFEATFIPPGATVLALEADRTPYTADPVTDFRCPAIVGMEPQSWERSVRVETQGQCGLTVTNLTQEPIRCVRIFYKQYYEAEDMYLGGVTYCLVVTQLLPGQSRSLSPYHFATRYSRVVAVTVEP